MKIVDKKITELKPYEKNPRKNDEAVDYVANSIKEFGFKVPIVIDKNNVIVAGHTRYKASKKLGLEEVPCIVADDLNEEQIKAFRLADNKVSEMAEWDFPTLDDELNDLTIDMEQFGFDIDFNTEEEQEIIEDEVPDVSEEPKAKLGDIYQLGNHRLMCGDSTNINDIEKTLNGNVIDLVLTDPPYGVEIVKGATIDGDKPFGKVRGAVGNSNVCKANEYIPIKGDETTDTAKDFYNLISQLSKAQIIFGGNYFTDFLYPSRCWLVWDKESPSDNFFADVELAWCSLDHNAKLYKWLWNGMCKKGDKKTEGTKRVHPTQKPVGMLGEILKDFSKENDIVFDGFGGSGSTLIACEQLNRRCYMIEYEPHYIDVIIQRWENFTGEKAIKIGGDKQ